MKVTIDRDGCVSCGACHDSCPAFFEENKDDTFSQVIGSYRREGNPAEGIVPADLEACVEEAAGLCPVEVIHVDS
jgi:ferredoxin